MIYLSDFYFVSPRVDEMFRHDIKRTCYESFYPFGVMPAKLLSEVSFSDVTIFYGGNGCGKTTALNMIACKIEADRMAAFNRTCFWQDYIDRCDLDYANGQMEKKCIITSDDVFDYMLDIRKLNEGIDTTREDKFQEYLKLKDWRKPAFKLESLDQIEELRRRQMAKSKTQSEFTRRSVLDNVREYSNGESAFRYFVEQIEPNGIYILDEPENSLSPEKQMELLEFLENQVRFFGCQFIISTHSPFLLSMRGAKIYDMEQYPVVTREWYELDNVRRYYAFFKKHERLFEM